MKQKIKYLLVDLDGTLIQFDMKTFIADYLRLIQVHFSSYSFANFVPEWIMQGTEAMLTNEGTMTNKDKFLASFRAKTALSEEEIWEKFLHFYRTDYDQIKLITHPVPGAREFLEKAVKSGYKLILATQPVFPLMAILRRLAWAGLDHLTYILITHIENMYASKPFPQYFEQILSMLGAMAEECLMIGNDREMDMASLNVGIPAFYLNPGPKHRVLEKSKENSGTYADLAKFLAIS